MRNILPILYIIASIGLYFTYIGPTYDAIAGLRAEDAKFTEALSRAEEFRQLLVKLQTKYNSFDKIDLERLSLLLPKDFDDVRYVREIDQIAQSHNLRIRNIDMSKDMPATSSEEQTPYGTFTLGFTLTTNYQSLLAFLSDIERDVRLTDLTSLSISALPDGLYTFNIELKTYWLVEQKNN